MRDDVWLLGGLSPCGQPWVTGKQRPKASRRGRGANTNKTDTKKSLGGGTQNTANPKNSQYVYVSIPPWRWRRPGSAKQADGQLQTEPKLSRGATTSIKCFVWKKKKPRQINPAEMPLPVEGKLEQTGGGQQLRAKKIWEWGGVIIFQPRGKTLRKKP